MRVGISTPVVSGEVYLHGAHVSGFQPKGQQPVLWMSGHSYFARGKPIRGGVPICFPWFGPHPLDASQPSHGFARLAEWELTMCGMTSNGGISMELTTNIQEFLLTYQIEFGPSLRMGLSVELPCSVGSPQRYEDALHTYLHVGDIRKVSILGLQSSEYLDKVGEFIVRGATGSPVSFHGETDRVYQNTTSVCTLEDEVLKRSITLRKTGSLSTVVWNPWSDKSKRMPDFGDDEWPGMVCIETANVGENAIQLTPGQTHKSQVEISVSC